MNEFQIDAELGKLLYGDFDALREITTMTFNEARIVVETCTIMRSDTHGCVTLVDRVLEDDHNDPSAMFNAQRNTIEAYLTHNEHDLRTLLARLLHRYLTSIDIDA